MLLGPGGEFAFVLLASATALGLFQFRVTTGFKLLHGNADHDAYSAALASLARTLRQCA